MKRSDITIASISKRGGKYLVRSSWYDDENKTFSKYNDAKTYAAEFEILKNKGFLSTDSSSSFASYFWDWFETYKESSVTDRTKQTYKQAYNA